jgi:integrase
MREKKALTERGLKALAAKPVAGKQVMIWDAVLPGFGVRVSGQGKLAFVVLRRPIGSKKPVRVTLGHFPPMTLEAARKAAQGALTELLAGKNPTIERERRIREQQEADAKTFAGVARRYLDHVQGKRAIRQITGIVGRELLPRFDGRPIASITKRELAAMIDEIKAKRSGPGVRKLGGEEAARQTLSYTKRIFKYAVARDLLDASPADAISSMELVGVKKPRQRTLSDEEIRKILAAFPWDVREGIEPQDRGRWPTAPMLWLLLLLGVRRGELAAATCDTIDLDKGTWLIPAENAKTGDAHVVPLPTMATRILRSLPRFAGDLVFTTDGYRQIGGWTAFKAEIDYKSGVAGWTLHDLRRTARTNWAKLNVPPHICEMMLGHAQKGIIGVYDTHRYEAERREALEAWSRRIQEIMSPPTPGDHKVVRLHGVAQR